MIYLYNEKFFWYPKLKKLFKGVLGINSGGPEAVERALEEGFKELRVSYLLNQKPHGTAALACVLSGVKTLKWAIRQKRLGRFKKIVAGPNIAMPADYGGLIFHPQIDIFLTPSPWVAEFCASFNPAFASKIKIWAAGVGTLADNDAIKTRKGKCFVYFKNKNYILLHRVCLALKSKGYELEVLEYGKYSGKRYISILRASDFGVFLTDSESQGLAIHKAWMMNVPTLVWNGGHMKYKNYEWVKSSPAPYLTPVCGQFFARLEQLDATLEQFINNLPNFSPRQYHLQNFTVQKTTQKYLSIIHDL